MNSDPTVAHETYELNPLDPARRYAHECGHTMRGALWLRLQRVSFHSEWREDGTLVWSCFHCVGCGAVISNQSLEVAH
jgi:hypothetical protein